MSHEAFQRYADDYDAAVRRHDELAAAIALRELVKEGEPFIAFLRRAARTDVAHHDYAAAEAKFRTLAALAPGADDINRAIAGTVIEQGDTVRALALLRELEGETQLYDDVVWLTEVYSRLGRPDLVRKLIRTEEARDRFGRPNLVALEADLVLSERGAAEARQFVTARIAEFGGPPSPNLLRRLARLNETEFDFLGALKAWSTLALGKGNDGDAHHAVTILLFLQAFDQALELTDQVLKQYPRYRATLQPLIQEAEHGRDRLAEVSRELGPTESAEVAALQRCLLRPASPAEVVWGRRALIEFLASARAQEADFLQFSQTLPNWEDYRIRRHALQLGLAAFPDSAEMRKRYLRFQLTGNALWRSGAASLAMLDLTAYDEEAIYQAIFCVRRLEQEPDTVTEEDAILAERLRNCIAAALPSASPRFRAFAQRSLTAIRVACPPWNERRMSAEDREALNRFIPFGFAVWEGPVPGPAVLRGKPAPANPVMIMSGQLRGFAQAWPSLHRWLIEPFQMPLIMSVWDRTSNARGRHADRLGRVLPRDVMLRLPAEERYDDVFERIYPATAKLLFEDVDVTADQLRAIVQPYEVDTIAIETASEAGYETMVGHRPELMAGVCRMLARMWRTETVLAAHEARTGQTFSHVVWARPDMEIQRLTADTVQRCLRATNLAYTNGVSDRIVGDYLCIFPRAAYKAIGTVFPAAMASGLKLFPWRPSRRDGAGREPTETSITATGSLSDALFAHGYGAAEITGLRCRLLGHTPPAEQVRASFDAEVAARQKVLAG